MNHKIKSALYFASFIIAVLVYLNLRYTKSVQNADIVTTTLEHDSSEEALN